MLNTNPDTLLLFMIWNLIATILHLSLAVNLRFSFTKHQLTSVNAFKNNEVSSDL